MNYANKLFLSIFFFLSASLVAGEKSLTQEECTAECVAAFKKCTEQYKLGSAVCPQEKAACFKRCAKAQEKKNTWQLLLSIAGAK